MEFPKHWLQQYQLDKEKEPENTDLSFAEMLHTDKVSCVGYVAKNGKPILYGKHYVTVHNL